jgi:hypothetical protein
MPGIRRKKEPVSIIEEEDDLEQGRRILLCPHCMDYGLKEPLSHKILMKGQKPAIDYQNWCQCVSGCGKIFARHEVKVEGILTDTIEVVGNPHDKGKSIVGLGNKVRKSGREKERQKLLDKIDEEKDPEIRAELKKGNIVTILND